MPIAGRVPIASDGIVGIVKGTSESEVGWVDARLGVTVVKHEHTERDRPTLYLIGNPMGTLKASIEDRTTVAGALENHALPEPAARLKLDVNLQPKPNFLTVHPRMVTQW